MCDHDENPKEMTATCNPVKDKALRSATRQGAGNSTRHGQEGTR